MYKFNSMEGEKFDKIITACKKSSILKTILSGAAFFVAVKLYDEAAVEAGYATGAKEVCDGVDRILNRLEKKDKFCSQDFVDENRAYQEEFKRDSEKE